MPPFTFLIRGNKPESQYLEVHRFADAALFPVDRQFQYDSNGLNGLPCGMPFLRLVSLPLIMIGALSHLRIRRSVKEHLILR